MKQEGTIGVESVAGRTRCGGCQKRQNPGQCSGNQPVRPSFHVDRSLVSDLNYAGTCRRLLEALPSGPALPSTMRPFHTNVTISSKGFFEISGTRASSAG